MKDKFYVTTPIYYVNDVPHIGHAYTTITADVLARYYREKLGKENVFFLTGTDEHGAKIAEAADNAGKNPKVFVDSLVPKFIHTWGNLNIKYDYFIRTTDPRHEKFVQDFITKVKKNGFLEKKKYEGLYCVSCEKFLVESDLIDECCPDHPGKKPIKHSEENWFFKLSKFQKPLLEAIKNKEYEILPETRKNEIVSKIKMGLEDISISRLGVKWGVPVPWDKSQTIYVWFEALLNYLSALKINKKEDFWPANVHLMAKDILWFHAIIWPAMLLAVTFCDNSQKGDCPLRFELPKKIFAHGFFTIAGAKMSKTVGNVIDPNKWVEKYGADAVRYYLLSAFPFGEDGDVSEANLIKKYNSDLANDLGNLVNRVIIMIKRYFPEKARFIAPRQDKACQSDKIDKFVENFQFDEALKVIWEDVREANNYIEQNKPWKLVNTNASLDNTLSTGFGTGRGKQNQQNRKKLEEVFEHLFKMLHAICYMLQVFLPDTSEKIESQLKSLNPEPLFPRTKE